MPTHEELLDSVVRLCKEAGILALESRKTLEINKKNDGSIVTNADFAAQDLFAERIQVIDPGCSFWGEEGDFPEEVSERLWVCDPVDGTSNFAYGQPYWGTTLALIENGEVQLGCIHLPELDLTYSAIKNQGAFLNGEALSQIKPGKVEPYELVGYGTGRMACYYDFPGKVRHVGSFVVEAGLFVTQGLRVLLTSGVRLYDAATGILMARELGAEIRTLTGEPWHERNNISSDKCEPFGFFPPGSDFPFIKS